MKLRELASLWLADVTAGKDNGTPLAYEAKIRHIVNFLGSDFDCNCISQENIDAFRRHILTRKIKLRGKQIVHARLSRWSCRGIIGTTINFLHWSTRKKYLPALELRNIQEPPMEPKAVDVETINALLASAARVGADWERARNTAIIYTLVDSGGRVGCLANMSIDQLSLNDGYAVALDKNNQQTWLYLNPPTVAAIRAWMAIRPELHPADRLLWTGAKKTGLGSGGIRSMINRLAHDAGVSDARHNPHAFRHAFARESILAGADLARVSQMMSHKSVSITVKYYARFTKKELINFHRQFSPGRNLPAI